MRFCCAEFAENTGKRDVGIEKLTDGSWCVNGCCHGGCYVLQDIKYCPFCGTKLSQEKSNEN
jgi:hypothetical protein